MFFSLQSLHVHVLPTVLNRLQIDCCMYVTVESPCLYYDLESVSLSYYIFNLSIERSLGSNVLYSCVKCFDAGRGHDTPCETWDAYSTYLVLYGAQ